MSTTVQLYVTGAANTPEGRRAERQSQLGAGGYWSVSQRVGLFAGYKAGITDDAVDGLFVAGLGFAF